MILLGMLGTVALATEPSPRAATARISDIVADNSAFIKQLWPATADPVLTDGRDIEFREGRIRLGSGGLSEIARESGPDAGLVLGFVLAHEAWHDIQSRRYSIPEFSRLRRDRVIECEADFMAGWALGRKLRRGGVLYSSGYQARSAIATFLRRKAVPASDVTTYLSPDDRARLFELGWYFENNPHQFRFSKRKTRSEGDTAREVCRHAAQENDGTADAIVFGAFTGSRVRAGSEIVEADVELMNGGVVPVSVSYMLVLAFTYLSLEQRNGIFKVIQDEFIIQPGSRIKKKFTVQVAPDRADRYADSWPAISGPSYENTAFITTRGVGKSWSVARREPDPPVRAAPDAADYCYARLMKVPSLADRALFSRLAAVALAAPEDFGPVREARYEGAYVKDYRTYPLMIGLGGSPRDEVGISSDSSTARMEAFESADESEINRERTRLADLIARECRGSSSRITVNAGDLTVRDFAPMARIDLESRKPVERLRGRVYFTVWKQREYDY